MRRRGWPWPIALGALLALSVAANVSLIVIAARDPSFAVERDYYRKALTWDETMAQERRNLELGWHAQLALVSSAVDRSAVVEVRLSDRDGRPIENARMHVEALHNARATRVFAVRLEPRGNGRYTAALPSARPGVWELRLRAEQGSNVFTETATTELERRS